MCVGQWGDGEESLMSPGKIAESCVRKQSNPRHVGTFPVIYIAESPDLHSWVQSLKALDFRRNVHYLCSDERTMILVQSATVLLQQHRNFQHVKFKLLTNTKYWGNPV